MTKDMEMSEVADGDKHRRVQMLEEARGLSLGGNYDEALKSVDTLLQERGSDVEALRLRGNVLELKALDFNEYSSKKLMTSRDYLDARRCYEQVLAQDPENTIALIDLGDHYKNLDAYDKALDYYAQATGLLEAGVSRLSWQEEIQEILERVAELPKGGASFRAEDLQVKCRKLLQSSYRKSP